MPVKSRPGDQPSEGLSLPDRNRVRPPLHGVPATALWALYHRASLLADPMAERVVERLGFPLESVLGRRTAMIARSFAERARVFDREIAAYLERHPDATVVALGEGLETQSWRVDNGRLSWLTVDLPEVVELRARVLPPDGRRRAVACSALDPRWTDHVPADRPVLIVAQGLLMYLRPAEVTGLIASCAERFPGGSLLFDTCPSWFTAMARLGLMHCGPFRIPPMYFSMSPAGVNRLRGVLPGLRGLRHIPWPRTPGLFGWALCRGHRIPLLRRTMPAIFRADFRECGTRRTNSPEKPGVPRFPTNSGSTPDM